MFTAEANADGDQGTVWVCDGGGGMAGDVSGQEGSTTGGEGDDDFRYKVEVEVRFRDLDPMNHVNNAVYFTYFEIG